MNMDNMPVDNPLGAWIKQRRKVLDLSQEELAERVGCSTEMIRKIESGLRRPSKQVADLLSEHLNVPAGERARFVQQMRRPQTPEAKQEVQVVEGTAAARAQHLLNNPYKGLRAFQEDDAPDFFGREALISQLVAHLSEQVRLSRFLAVVGPSGSGKSSVVRAGLIPALRRGSVPALTHAVVADLVPGTHPLEELEAALLRVAVNPPTSLREQLESDERGLARAVKRVLPGDTGTELVLFIDQFEELFTMARDEAERNLLLNSIYSSVNDPRSRLWVVVTLRADFYDRPLLYSTPSELFGLRTQVVGPMKAKEWYEAIVNPAERVGVVMESDLAATIEQDVADQPGALPLLEYALTELFDHRQGQVMTLAAYRASGGVLGAVGQRAEQIYMGLDTVEQEEARQFFLRLVTLNDGLDYTRRRARRAELASAARDEEAFDKAVEAFGHFRLLTFDRDLATRSPTVEVAHEALVTSWTRLQGWLDASRDQLLVQRRLMSASADWVQAGRDSSFLADGTRLAQFEALAEGAVHVGGVALTGEEKEYVQTSLEERDRHTTAERERQQHEVALQKRATSRARYLAVALGLFLIVALSLSYWAINRSTAADANLVSAQRAFTTSEGQRLAAEANNLLQSYGSAEVIGLLSVLAMHTDYSPQADAALEGAATLDYPRQRFAGHTDAVYGVTFSPDSKYILTAGGDNTARMWDVQTGKEVHRFSGHTDGVIGVAFSPDGKSAVSCGHDKTTRIWDTQTGAEARRFTGSDGVWSCKFSPDGSYILTGGVDKIAHLWDVRSGTEVRRFIGHTDIVYGVAFSPDGKYALTAGTGDKTARMWDVQTGKEVRRFTGDISGVVLVSFSPDAKYVLASSWDKVGHVWDAATGNEVRRFTGHTLSTKGVMFSPDGKLALTSSDDTTARLWDAQTGVESRRLIGHTSAVYDAAFSPDGRYIATGSADKTALLWDVEVNTGLPQFTGHTDNISAFDVAFSPDGKHVLTGSFDKTVRLWDSTNGKGLLRLVGHTDHVTSVGFSPDGTSIISASDDKTIRVWNTQTGAEMQRLSAGGQGFARVVFSHNGLYIAAAGAQDQPLLDAQTGAVIRKFTGQIGQAWSVDFSPDDKYLLTGITDKTAGLWDVQTGKELRRFTGHTQAVKDAVFSPDGKQVLTCSDDKTAKLWDTATGQTLQTFTGHTDRVSGCAFSPDGKYVLTGSDDKTARLWDAHTGKELRRFTGHTDSVISVAYAPDGKTVLTGSVDKTARLWRIDYHDTLSYVCGRLVRDFSDEERAQYNINTNTLVCP
jgi:WD40 repeat protein/transcriptional regulator with XRE-family HTH domain